MPSLLTALDCEKHIHLIIGSNPLASARCAKSIEVGAKPKIIAPADADVHYVLAKRIEDGEVEWIQDGFKDDHLTTLGRNEVENVVDAVFITSGGKSALSMQGYNKSMSYSLIRYRRYQYLHTLQTQTDTSQCS